MSKKSDERPRWRCHSCGAAWVYHSPECVICGLVGSALNKRAERILRRYREESNEDKESVKRGKE